MRRHVGGGGVLAVLPALRRGPRRAAGRAAAEGPGQGGRGGAGVRQPHGAVLHGLPARPHRLLLLQLGLQGLVRVHLLPSLPEEETPDPRQPGPDHQHHHLRPQDHHFTHDREMIPFVCLFSCN